jgi:hypothetical protein
MCELDAYGSGQGPVGGSCEHDNEPLGSIKGGGGVSGVAEWLLASQEGLCSMEFVS